MSMHDRQLVPLRGKRKFLRAHQRQAGQRTNKWASWGRQTVTVKKPATINRDVSSASPDNDTSNSSGILRGGAPVFEPKASLGGTPRGVKSEGRANNAAGTLRGDAPVFHPKASGEETERVLEGLVGPPVGVKTEGQGSRAESLEAVTMSDEEGEGSTNRACQFIRCLSDIVLVFY